MVDPGSDLAISLPDCVTLSDTFNLSDSFFLTEDSNHLYLAMLSSRLNESVVVYVAAQCFADSEHD